MVVQPRPQFLGVHRVDARGTGVLFDASERLGEILAGQEQLPQVAHVGGVSIGAVRRRIAVRSDQGSSGFTFPPRPWKGLAAVNATTTSTNVLTPGFAFGPSQRPSIPPVVQPLLTSPRRATPSRTPPSRTTPRTRRTGHLGHPRRSPRVRPTTFIAHPPRFRNGPLMASGFASWCRLARAAPLLRAAHPTSDPARCAMCSWCPVWLIRWQ
jgi:hypothetical protein